MTAVKKIEFYTHPVVGKENKPVNAKYILLSYFLSDHNDVETITRTISEIEAVKNKQQTFDEVFTDKYGTIPISVNAGIFECNSNTAYLVSNNPGLEADVTLPVDEFIDILNEWKAFLA